LSRSVLSAFGGVPPAEIRSRALAATEIASYQIILQMGSNLSIFVFLDRHRFGRSRQLREFLALVRLVARLKSIGAKHAAAKSLFATRIKADNESAPSISSARARPKGLRL
jgi:hypothetical protein